MDYFVPETQAFANEQQVYNTEENSEYRSPLESRPSFPEQHYNNGTAQQSTYKPMPKTQFQGFCHVCQLQLNSYLQSKSHHEGKKHARNLKKAQEEAEKQENPSTITQDEPPNKKAKTVPVTNLYCNACNLTFTSETHAHDHYLGRNHDRVLHGLAPFTQGYFNTTTSKWQRTPPDPRVSAQLLSSEPPADIKGKPAYQDKPKIRGKFHCEVCNCSLTCELQLQNHMVGSRHAKTVKKLAAEEAFQKEAAEGNSATSTLSGAFRCEVCTVSMNSSIQYQQHILSKKHEARVTKAEQDQAQEGNAEHKSTNDQHQPSQ